MGGQRVLEWAVMYPERVQRAIVIAAGAQATAEQIALCSLQVRAIESDPRFLDGDYYDAAPNEGPWRGMSIARGIGQVSYRSELELAERFDRTPQPGEDPLTGGRYGIESYLEYHGEKLAHRFDANTYITLSRAMNHHDVGRGRGGVAAALALVTAHVTLGGVNSDRLYPLRLQHELAQLLPRNSGVQVIESIAGHDAFLVEHEQVGKIIASALLGP
jgi:homoserine O-acetyltransferase